MHQLGEAKLCYGKNDLKISTAYKNKVLYFIHAMYPLRVNCSSALKHLPSGNPNWWSTPPYLDHCGSHSKEKGGHGVCQFLLFLLAYSHFTDWLKQVT